MTEQRYVAHGLVAIDDRILLLQRRQGRYLGEYWDIPGGTVEADESPEDAAIRECFEETNLKCQLGPQLTHFQNMDTEGRDITFHTITYRLFTEPNPLVTISQEHQDCRWATVAEAHKIPVVWHVERTLTVLG